MCTTCGCSDDARATLTDPATGRTWTLTALAPDGPSSLRGGLHGAAHAHEHAHAHAHAHVHPSPDGHAHPGHADHADHDHHPDDHGPARAGPEDTLPGAHTAPHGTTVSLDEPVLAANDRLAERNRGWLAGRGALAINLLGAPGAGKTALLERTAVSLAAEAPLAVIEGDQATSRDAERLQAAGCATVQLNTGPGCHLEADMVAGALRRLDPAPGSLVLIENVGNLVCPALFDLGEHGKVVVLSVTEGDEKPLKYPHVFHAAALLVINKTDLLPHVTFDPEACIANARAVHPGIEVLQVSATTGEGMEAWYDWLRVRLATRPDGDRLRA